MQIAQKLGYGAKSMNAVKSAAIWLSVLLSIAVVSDAAARGNWGHGHHGYHRHNGVRIGIAIGVPSLWYSSPYYYRPYFRSYPYPYYPPAIVEPIQPQEYIERGQAAPAANAPASAYWHYCAESGAYYPYVKECAGPWQRVAPVPSPS